MRHISIVLNKCLSGNYSKKANLILQIIQQLQKIKFKEDRLEFMFFPDFIEVYGIKDYDISIKAFEQITQFTSCEFAVRPFIIKYQDKMIEEMKKWSKHNYSTVRRLASEGCRPRLPWAMAIPMLKADPTPILPILENLKNDPSEYVRRSVANNLNDISKDNPKTVINIAKKWLGKTRETDKLVKHACRTLLKQGNQELMPLFGFGSIDKINITYFKIITPKVKLGAFLEFKLNNLSNLSSKIRLEYGLYYQKANSTLSKKVFKISEKEYSKNSTTSINRKQPFKIITTRKFHLGKHQLSIIINGKEFEILDFELIKN
ncbi:DNA alkylation repair protein [Flavivirga aquatica]|uniref:DNA alkylation repair protein n=1 Tax=Flavivirga aquatica TaxID=1849968 RepID=UPI000B143EF0|nr:DNA alkylation repair protein [Flavivirga aquatica]